MGGDVLRERCKGDLCGDTRLVSATLGGENIEEGCCDDMPSIAADASGDVTSTVLCEDHCGDPSFVTGDVLREGHCGDLSFSWTSGTGERAGDELREGPCAAGTFFTNGLPASCASG